jgi:hypothetical protein
MLRNTLIALSEPDLQNDNIECLWMEIKFKNKKYLYGTFSVDHKRGWILNNQLILL